MTRSRTRQAILSAAASVLAQNRAATLPEIAEAAGVGRTTLHRYFPDRDALINAAVADSMAAIEQAVAEARIDDGSPLEAVRRLVTAYLHVGDRLVFLFNDPHVMRGYGVEAGADPGPDPVLDLIQRGQAEGVFDTEVSPQWIRHVLWALVYTGIDEVGNGTMSRHGVASTVMRTLERGILG
ncbi:AcrR family transcriptional regulator [Kibdelosporangium banguiense]|uniref:AcrR family transcriptional regulator n=1 Tax=Kibdelosporangium banguiense TaxID=1365924 RepID=A0ABS4T9E5_9PSEU|nr:TetR/AcrR family transcriptional regulator [Kibdelosporangium banguiense]MBP2321040.1 AcrR family transcriptional regulator [Kibdelosporangium banguiense]